MFTLYIIDRQNDLIVMKGRKDRVILNVETDQLNIPLWMAVNSSLCNSHSQE